MPIPDYETLMLPFLKLINDGKEWSFKEIVERLADEYNLTGDERKAPTPSGRIPIINSRVSWARTYLKKAGLIEAPKRKVSKITQRGIDLLKTNPSKITSKSLEQYPEFLEFVRPSAKWNQGNENAVKVEISSEQSPEETFEYSYIKIRQELAQELLTQIKNSPPDFFEGLVVELLLKMGYGGSREDAGKAIGKSGDEGIDGIINEDRLGLDVIYIQAKRWVANVGRPEIQQFVGALEGKKAKKGILITTSGFTKDAVSYASSVGSRIVLIDGEKLVELMIDFDIGVSKVASYEIKKIDMDYFTGE